MKQRSMRRGLVWLRQHWRKVSLFGFLAVVGGFILVQVVYPYNRLPLYTVIDGLNVSGWKKDDAAAQLNDEYKNVKLSLKFGESNTAYRTPTLTQVGRIADNTERLETVSYGWWRLVPTSLFWAHAVIDTGEPTYTTKQDTLKAYMQKELGESCSVAPKNATARATADAITLVSAENGGTCKQEDIVKAIAQAKPLRDKDSTVRIAMTTIAPKVTDEQVKAVIDELQRHLVSDFSIMSGEKTVRLPAKAVRSWLLFSTTDDTFSVSLSPQKAQDELNTTVAPVVTRAAGVTTVTTHDFVETGRVSGASGSTLNVQATLESITQYLLGENPSATAVAAEVAPTVKYNRTYSPTDTGLSALMKNYAESHPGTYGVSMIELSGQRRRATYNDTRKFTTASTYKLYVAYSTLKRIESGAFSWSDTIANGRNLTVCFDDMIVKSDNACAEALVAKIGYRALTNEAVALGATSTSFVDVESYTTTAGDLTTFLGLLETGQISLNTENRTKLISAMKRNVYRQGIPAGSSGTVADKVGFLEGFLHDAAIVYSPSGTYVLAIMTDGSSWASIAELTKQIEALRAQ